MIIAIDGPAGSGKTTTAYSLAKKLNIFYLDTGATYRVLTLKALAANVDLDNRDEIKRLAENLDIRIEENRVYLEGRDVTNQIRTPLIDENISKIAANSLVREIMVNIQRNIVDNKDYVVEGRDTTTVVFPEAEFKFYLDAEFLERARRRYSELKNRGVAISFDQVKEQLKQRDEADFTRKIGALKKAEGAIYVDTTNLSIEEVVDKLMGYITKNYKPES